jgi:exosome complex component RRP40
MDDVEEYPRYVLPGERVPCFSGDLSANPSEQPKTVKLGPGLLQEKDNVIAIKAGVLHRGAEGMKWWIESDQRRVSFLSSTISAIPNSNACSMSQH